MKKTLKKVKLQVDGESVDTEIEKIRNDEKERETKKTEISNFEKFH